MSLFPLGAGFATVQYVKDLLSHGEPGEVKLPLVEGFRNPEEWKLGRDIVYGGCQGRWAKLKVPFTYFRKVPTT